MRTLLNSPPINGSTPKDDALTTAVLRDLDEQREIDALVRAVLQRLNGAAPSPVQHDAASSSDTPGILPPPEGAEPVPEAALSCREPEIAAAAVGETLEVPTTDGGAPLLPLPVEAQLAAEPIEHHLARPRSPDAMAHGAEVFSAAVEGHPLVAPFGTRLCAHSWEGRLTRKPWDYPITAVIPHLETPEPLRACVELLRLQTNRPYIMVIDTGSSERMKAALEAMRAGDLEVHYIGAHGYQHVSGAVSAAQDLAFALCRSEYLYCTHADCFLRRRDYLEWLLSLCGRETPAVGYQMSPRDWLTDEWQGMVSHTATLLHMPSMRRLGVTWSIERSCEQFGVAWAHSSWPDTETSMNLCMRAAGVRPHLIGDEENFKRHLDENLDHVRSFPGSQVYGPDYYARAQTWMEQALLEAWQRISLWRAADLKQ